MIERPRRIRSTHAMRRLAQEAILRPANLVLPVFVEEGEGIRRPIASMPGVVRYSIDELVSEVKGAMELGIAGVAVFPAIADSLKDSTGSEGWNPDGLMQRSVKAIKQETSDLLVITDVALDPYSSDGHDGLVRDGEILNDETLVLLEKMAVSQAKAGADVVAPSDMMDGRVGAIRGALDAAGFEKTAICSYCIKYASAFYGPFRDALDSAPKSGDKKTYQMDPHNAREAVREIALDEAEGADWIMVKPGLPYLDVVRAAREATPLPIAAYHVSGEYAMLRAAAAQGWLDYDTCLLESLVCLRRAGADVIFTYGALDAARLLAASAD